MKLSWKKIVFVRRKKWILNWKNEYKRIYPIMNTVFGLEYQYIMNIDDVLSWMTWKSMISHKNLMGNISFAYTKIRSNMYSSP